MEQTNMVMAMFQAMTAQGMVPKTGKAGDKASGDFQKLLDQKSQTSAKSDAPAEDTPKAEAAPVKKEEAPVPEKDVLEQVKKLAEQGYAIVQPSVAIMTPDGQVYQPGEYVIAWDGAEWRTIPVVEMSPWQKQQLQQLTHNMELMENAKDPEADAILEATDPTVEHSPAQLLEKALDEQAGNVVRQAAEGAQPQKKDEDAQVELVDVDQGPRQLFHDVEAAPVKVGEAYDAQPAQEPDVAGQIDAQLAQALQTGESMVRIQLTPENLGEVTVEISQSADGALRVALTAHNADTRGLLERHAGDLQGMLTGRTQQDVEVSVQRQAESQQNQNQQHNYDGRNGHAQDGQDRRQRRQEHASPEDFMQQLRLGLIPDGGGI